MADEAANIGRFNFKLLQNFGLLIAFVFSTVCDITHFGLCVYLTKLLMLITNVDIP